MVNGAHEAAAIVATDRDVGSQARRGSAQACWVSGTRRQPNDDRLGPCLFLFLGWLFGRPLERGAQDVAERRAGIGRAVLCDRLFLLRHFERLDGDLYLVGAAIELDDPSIHLLSDGETLRPLLAAITRQLRALDESREIAADDIRLKTRLLHLGHFAGDDRSLLEVAGRLHGIAVELLDAERNALLLDVDVEHLRLDLIALLVFLDHLLAGTLPVQV